MKKQEIRQNYVLSPVRFTEIPFICRVQKKHIIEIPNNIAISLHLGLHYSVIFICLIKPEPFI